MTYESLAAGKRPKSYDYPTTDLVHNGFAHQYTVNPENPDLEIIKTDLRKSGAEFEIRDPNDGSNQVHLWVKK